MNNLCQGYNFKKIIPFLPSHPPNLSSCQTGCLFCYRNLLNNICFLAPGKYESAKRNKTLKNPQKKKGSNDSFCRPLNT